VSGGEGENKREEGAEKVGQRRKSCMMEKDKNVQTTFKPKKKKKFNYIFFPNQSSRSSHPSTYAELPPSALYHPMLLFASPELVGL
jgi:hypothetical protein